MQESIQKLICLSVKLSLLIALVFLTRQTDAQVVPYRTIGTGVGSLLDLSATGEGVGLHLGRYTWDSDGDVTTDVAADGSTLELLQVQTLLLEFSDPDPETGEVIVFLMQELEVIGGTGRFENAQAAPGNVISTIVSEPFDPEGDLTAIPFAYRALGQFDLGRRN
jgi:hypothetical protein